MAAWPQTRFSPCYQLLQIINNVAQAQVQLLTPSNLEKSLGKGQIQVQNVQLQTGNQDYSSLIELIKIFVIQWQIFRK